MPINSKLLDSIKSNAFTDSVLELNEKNLEDDDIVILSSALKNNHHIKSLHLNSNNFSDKGICVLADNLPDQLEELDVSDNRLTGESCIALSKTNLKKIDISATSIGDGVSAFGNSTSLTELLAFQCDITDEGAAPLFSSPSIITLDLGNNRIAGISLQHIPSNSVLRSLKLTQNPIVEENCRYIVENKSLTHLNLTNTYLGDRAAILLAQNTSLQSLFISQCFIKNAGALAFSNNSTLKKLLLDSNRIEDEGARALADNISLLYLNLEGNPISRNTITYLKERYIESEYLVFTRGPKYIEELEKKRNASEATSSSSSSNPGSSSYIDRRALLSFTPHHQQTIQPPKEELDEKELVEKTKQLISKPEFENFLATIDPQQLNIVLEYIRKRYQNLNQSTLDSDQSTHKSKKRKMSDPK